MPTTSAASAAMPARGSRNSAAIRIASSTAAVPARLRNSGNVGALRLLELLAGATEAPLAAAVGCDRRIQRRAVEIGPERVGEVQLGVRELPQQEVADALLAPGADEEVGLRRVAHGKVGRKLLFLNFLCPGVFLEKPAHRLQDVPAAAVVRGDGEREPPVAGGARLALLDQLADLR